MRTQHLIPAAALIVLASVASADADPVKCTRTIAKEYGKYIAASSKIIDKCKNGVIAKGTPATLAGCPDAAGAQKIADNASKMKAKIAGQCGGADKTCDGVGDDPLNTINFNDATGDGFEGQCAQALADCDDIGDYLICIGDLAVEQGVDDLFYDEFNPAQFFPANASEPAKTNNKCQVTIAKVGVKFLQAKIKSLNKCWDAKLNNKTGFADNVPCPNTDPGVGSGNPPASPGDNKTVEAIKKAEQKKVASICKACGGGGDADKNTICDTLPGFPLADIVQTPYICPNVTVPPNDVHPSGLACGAISVTDLQSYIDCIDCVLEFKADCTTSAGVGDNTAAEGINYPAECLSGGEPTPTATPAGTATPTPTPTGATATPTGPAPTCTPRPNCGNGVLDAGEDCDPAVFNSCPSNALCAPANLCDACTCPTGDFTLSAVAGADLDTGWTGIAHDQSALVGHLFDANAYGCSGAGPDTQCSFVGLYDVPFFGPPLPLSSGGVPVCVVNQIIGTPTGTLDLVTGELHYDYDLQSKVHNGITNDQPCPTCVGDPIADDDVLGGTCSGGVNNGGACDADAVSPIPSFGSTSFNCNPLPGANIGTLPISFKDAHTGTKTISTSAASPTCTAFGHTGFKCYCDTCDDVSATPCASNVDCAPGGICGGLRCLTDSTTPGTPCANEGSGQDPVCGFGTCGLGVCTGVTCTSGPRIGESCSIDNDCNECITGPHPGTGCLTDDDCGGTCSRAGQPTQINACLNGVCIVGGGPGDGQCQTGPTDSLCSIEPFRTCTMDNDCRPPSEGGNCATCAPGNQTCGTKRRECFRSTVSKTGTAGIPNGAYAGNFCIAPTASAAVNQVAGLPGLGALVLPYTLSINVP